MSKSPNRNPGPVRQAGEATRREASATADQTKAAAGGVAATAKEQAGTVAGEARDQARHMVGDLRQRAAGEADSQAKRTAGTLRQWADDLSDMAQSARRNSPLRGIALQAADRAREAADALERKGAGGLVEGLESFARRRPGMFLGAAALAGMAVGRITKAGAKSTEGSGQYDSAYESRYGDQYDETGAGRSGEDSPSGKWGTPRPEEPGGPGARRYPEVS